MDKQKIFDFFIKIFLFLSPIFTFKDYQLTFARGLFFSISVIFLFGLSLGLEQKRKLYNKWISLLFILLFFRVFFDNNIENSEYFNFWMSFSSFFYVFCGILLFNIIYCYSGNIKQYFKPIILVCIMNFILTIFQFFNCDFVWHYTHVFGKICGFMETPAQLGQYSAMSLPILFFVNPFLSIIPLTTLLLSKSVSPILSVFIVFIFILLKLKKKILATLFISVFLIGIICNFSYVSVKWSTRPMIWKKTLSCIFKKPYLGWGYRSFNDKVLKESNRLGIMKSPHAYNDYFHTAQEFGIPIVIVFGLFLLDIFNKIAIMGKKYKIFYCLLCSVVIVLINMSGQALIRFSSISSTFIVLLALLSVYIDERTGNGYQHSNN